jgi:hypothetical protein
LDGRHVAFTKRASSSSLQEISAGIRGSTHGQEIAVRARTLEIERLPLRLVAIAEVTAGEMPCAYSKNGNSRFNSVWSG